MKQNYLLNKTSGKFSIILSGLLFCVAGTPSASGQTTTTGVGQTIETIYVNPDQDYELRLQDPGVGDNLNGFIKWRVEQANGTNVTATRLTSSDLTLDSSSSYYSWFNGGNQIAPEGKVFYKHASIDDTQPDLIICEASSVKDDSYTGVVKKYIVKSAVNRAQFIRSNREAFTHDPDVNGWLNDTNSSLNEALIQKLHSCFKEVYEIHTPGNVLTNFRLDEKLKGYCLLDNSDTYASYAGIVRWRIYDSEGRLIEIPKTYNNILQKQLTFSGSRVKYYITAEVAINENSTTWYPVSFKTIFLEPNGGAMTQQELNALSTTDEAFKRTDYALREPYYVQIGEISFDDPNNLTMPRATNNYPASINEVNTIMPSSPYYAYAYPDQYTNRRMQNRFVGRGEYGLYKSLGIEGVSRYSQTSQEPFYSFWTASNGYSISVHDRTYMRTSAAQHGYFLFVDAADEPGTITELTLQDNALCPNTQLVVTAWLANFTPPEGSSFTNADVGFIFKGVDNTGKETILTKFFTGQVRNNPAIASNYAPVNWQQYYFSFNFPEGNSNYQSYKLEVVNNSLHSNGADYAIDDIRIYRSLPNISVTRKNACEASTLMVSSDYETLMRNMGWNEDPDALSHADLSNRYVRKYRYGLKGANPYTTRLNHYIGNIYYGFTNDRTKDATQIESWITLDKNLYATNDPRLQAASKTIRVAVPTLFYERPGDETEVEFLPTDARTAQLNEIILNLRAVNDFLSETEQRVIMVNDEPQTHEAFWSAEELNVLGMTQAEIKTALNNLGCEITPNSPYITGSIRVPAEEIANNPARYEAYKTLVKRIFNFMKIPLIHCPWRHNTIDTELYLGQIFTEETDLHYQGEKLESGITASGKYSIVLFGDAEVNSTEIIGRSLTANVNFQDPCLLWSEFTIMPSFTITINTHTTTTGIACQGSLAKVEPTLWVADIDEYQNLTGEVKRFEDAYPGYKHTFDWFLGSMAEYEQCYRNGYSLQDYLTAFRESQDNPTARFTKAEILNYYQGNQNVYALFDALLGNNETEPQLIIGNGTNPIEFRWEENFIAIPYVPTVLTDANQYQFCTRPQAQELSMTDAPEMAIGFPEKNYPAELNHVPLRVGLSHLKTGYSLVDVPIQKNLSFGSTNANAIGLPNEDNRTVYLRQGQDYSAVGTVTDLYANQTNGGQLSITFNYSGAYFNEGETYALYIPFGEYEGSTKIVNSCEGYAILPIKVVPTYLSWQGNDTSDVWYNDGNWKQSTKGELFFEGEANKDANGSDDVTKAFAPLYFTKITIPDDKILAMSDQTEITSDDAIQYDMAVDCVTEDGNSKIKIVPYYINKVDEIYFKPGATLMNQQRLTYNKAWVEFYLNKNQPYWMASPLYATYAGDFYAPVSGKQDTPAFTDITYDTATNNRWGLPFYQKAWNRAVAYSLNEAGTSSNGVDAVASNWSIEYNDVWVPYSIGKGFYVRYGENEAGIPDRVKVRLPKADMSYRYESFRADLSTNPTVRTDYARLAGDEQGEVSVDLASIDGDGTHFLIGNPYMTYLDMEKFFEVNTNLTPKYWTLQHGATNAHVVGTPDVNFDENAAGYSANSGMVTPMQAFFVELASSTAGYSEGEAEGGTSESPMTIKFTPSMMKAAEQTSAESQALTFKASHPMVTLTATQNGRSSHAILLIADDGDNSYMANEDAVALIDSELEAPIVYSVAGSLATQVNRMKTIDNVAIGVYSQEREEMTLTLSGLDQFVSPLSLYDAKSGTSQRLERDSQSITLTGSSHGRYFLRSDLTTSAAEVNKQSISIFSTERGKVIVNALRPIRSIQVFTIGGNLLRQWEVNSTQQLIHLPAGIYLIQASDDSDSYTEKVVVR